MGLQPRDPVPGRAAAARPAAVAPLWRQLPAAATARVARSHLILACLNAGLVARETFAGSALARLRWLLAGCPPFRRDRLAEIPLYAPLDCDLLGLPAPGRTPHRICSSYARSALRDAVARPAAAAMIIFHDWIVAGGNRLVFSTTYSESVGEMGLKVSTIAGSAIGSRSSRQGRRRRAEPGQCHHGRLLDVYRVVYRSWVSWLCANSSMLMSGGPGRPRNAFGCRPIRHCGSDSSARRTRLSGRFPTGPRCLISAAAAGVSMRARSSRQDA